MTAPLPKAKVDEQILLYAMRYALGRQTYATSDVQEAVQRALPLRDEKVRRTMIADIEGADRLRRDYPEEYKYALGHPLIDAPEWLDLLARIKANR